MAPAKINNMPTIGIIDDRKDLRDTLERKIFLSLKKQNLLWAVLGISPFSEMKDYISWIRENDIGILILDERLQEVNETAGSVSYKGSDLIEFIRSTLQDFPVFAITGYENDEDLQNRFPLFDEILSRDKFFAKADDYTLRFTRAGQRFIDIYNDHLKRISIISSSIALGEAKKEDIEELNKIQEYLNIPFTSYSYVDR